MIPLYAGNIADTCNVVDVKRCNRNKFVPHVTLPACGQKIFKENVQHTCRESEFVSSFKCYVRNCESDTYKRGNAHMNLNIGIVFWFLGVVLLVLRVIICICTKIKIC